MVARDEAAPLHPQIRALVEDSDPGDAEPSDLVALRGAYAAIAERLGGLPPGVATVADDAVPEGDGPAVPVRVYRPRPAPEGPSGVIVYVHGGGWMMGDLDGFDRIARALCAASGHDVVSVDYRLAPESPFPAARDDVLAAIDWATGAGAATHGWDGRRLVLCGDSAGGQLVAVAARHRRGQVRAQILAYPALDGTVSGASYALFGPETMLTREDMVGCWDAYAGATDRRHPDLSPGLADDLEDLPPTLVVLASHDVVRDDGLAYAERLSAAGVRTELIVVEGHVHGFLRWAGAVDAAGEALVAMGRYAAAALVEGPD